MDRELVSWFWWLGGGGGWGVGSTGWVYGCMGVWVYGCKVLWVYGCMGVWVQGCMGVWVYGCMWSDLLMFLVNSEDANVNVTDRGAFLPTSSIVFASPVV